MDNKPYSKREEDDFRKNTTATLTDILAQTKKTNGRVSSLENWQWFLRGITAVIVILLIPILLAFIQSGKL